MVPTFTCGFFRSNTPFAMSGLQLSRLTRQRVRLSKPLAILCSSSDLDTPTLGTTHLNAKCTVPNADGRQSCHRGLNPGPPPYQGGALPLSYGSDLSRAASRRHHSLDHATRKVAYNTDRGKRRRAPGA